METTTVAAPSRKPYFFVLQTGVITTVIALARIYWLNNHTEDFNVMGWYANYVIPIGAVIVGFVAGSGYGLASWFSGLRISRWLLLTVLLFQACAYVAAEYVEYRDALRQEGAVLEKLKEQGMIVEYEPPSFFEYYDSKARLLTWKPKSGEEEGEPLGGWGYVFVLLGAAGFIGSGLIAPAILMAVPYCDQCQRYMSNKQLGVLPASVPLKKLAKTDTAAKEAHEKEQSQAAEAADQAVQRLRDAAAAGDAVAFKQELASHGLSKVNDKLPRRVQVSLIWCKACEGGHVLPTVVVGTGDKVQRTAMEKIAAGPDFVRNLLRPTA